MTITVRVSNDSLWQRFHGCDPAYIESVCHSRCCDAPGRPSGTMIAIHPNEAAAIAARGVTVTDGLLESPDRVCPFKTTEHLCGLHFTPDKPFGCIASPFTLTSKDCLIVRNRYRRLVCYGEGIPAFEAFRASLDLLFGPLNARLVVLRARHLEGTKGQQFEMPMLERSYRMLKDLEKSRESAR